MINALLTVMGGILSYFLSPFGADKLFYPGFDAPFVAWKVFFAFCAAAAVFVSAWGKGKGLALVLLVGLISAGLLGINYQHDNPFPPIASPTDISWFAYQAAQACFFGVAGGLISRLKVLGAGASKAGS